MGAKLTLVKIVVNQISIFKQNQYPGFLLAPTQGILITILCYYLYSTEFKIPEGFPSFAIDTEELNDNYKF